MPGPITRRSSAALGAALLVITAGCGGAASPLSAARTIDVARTIDAAGSGPQRDVSSGWPTLLHGPSHFGAAEVRGPSSAKVRWQRQLEGPIVPGPVTLGKIAYVASNGGVLHAIDLGSGTDRWSFDGRGTYGSDLSTAPAVLRDGLILWPGPRHRLFALTPQGRLSWTLSLAADPLTPAIDPARHMLVVADTSGGLSAYRLRSGHAPVRLWSRALATTSYGNPALAQNGTTYETAGASLFAVSAVGRVLWQVETPAQVEVSAAIAEDGTVVFGSNDRREYGVSATGRIRWVYRIGNYTYSSPLGLAGHRVVFGDHSGNLNTLDSRTGQLVARDHIHGLIWTAAAVDVRGDIYFASRSGGIYAFAPDERRLFTLQTTATFDSYPAIAADGTLLIGDDSGILRAIR